MVNILSKISRAVLNIIYPIDCQGCGIKLPYDNERYLCAACLKKIRLNRPPFCISCGRQLNNHKDIKTLCPDCLKREFHFKAAWQCCKYEGLVKELIHKFKYNNKLFLKKIHTEILCSFCKAYVNYRKIDGIVPVPMKTGPIRKRAFNQAGLLAAGVSKQLDLPLLGDCLAKVKKTKKQVRLKRDKRLINMKGAFVAKTVPALQGKRLLLIDDVFTTGATADECSKALRAAGAESVWVLALARGA